MAFNDLSVDMRRMYIATHAHYPGKSATFSMSDLCEWSAATAPQVEHWCRLGIIVRGSRNRPAAVSTGSST